MNDGLLVYQLRKPTVDGHTEIYLTPLEILYSDTTMGAVNFHLSPATASER